MSLRTLLSTKSSLSGKAIIAVAALTYFATRDDLPPEPTPTAPTTSETISEHSLGRRNAEESVVDALNSDTAKESNISNLDAVLDAINIGGESKTQVAESSSTLISHVTKTDFEEKTHSAEFQEQISNALDALRNHPSPKGGDLAESLHLINAHIQGKALPITNDDQSDLPPLTNKKAIASELRDVLGKDYLSYGMSVEGELHDFLKDAKLAHSGLAFSNEKQTFTARSYAETTQTAAEKEFADTYKETIAPVVKALTDGVHTSMLFTRMEHIEEQVIDHPEYSSAKTSMHSSTMQYSQSLTLLDPSLVLAEKCDIAKFASTYMAANEARHKNNSNHIWDNDLTHEQKSDHTDSFREKYMLETCTSPSHTR